MEVATERFALLGYRGTTTSHLASAAGVTEPILYRHFKSKLNLFVTLVEEIGQRVIDGWRSALEEVADPETRLKIVLAGNPSTSTEERNAYRVIFHAMTEIDRDPEIAEPLKQHLGGLHKFLKSEIKRLQNVGAVRDDMTSDALAWLLMDVAVGYGMLSALGLPGHSQTTGKRRTQEMLLTFLAEEPA